MWCVCADEGYGPTWDSDDEYDNFIRKMNPPRCIRRPLKVYLCFLITVVIVSELQNRGR
jgi:hypothetical protein